MMYKTELVLESVLRAGVGMLRQRDIATSTGVSIGTVNQALVAPTAIGAVETTSVGTQVTDRKKLLTYFATHRRFASDTAAKLAVDLEPSRIEAAMIPEALFTGPSGYKFAYESIPADYDTVYVYLDEAGITHLKQRFVEFVTTKRKANLFVVKRHPLLKEVSPYLLYGDLWSIPHWWAMDFVKALEVHLGIFT